jgi:acyl-CoA synthetase (AMP-forming)/AMP-acid ligase II
MVGVRILMAQFATLTELLVHRAQEQADTISYSFIDGQSTPPSLTYQELYRHATQVASELIAKEIHPQEIAVLMFPPGLELIVAYFGCLLANVIPIVIQPPANQQLYLKFTSILTEVDANVILLSPELSQIIQRSKHFRWLRPFQKCSRWVERVTHLSHFLPHLERTPSIIVDLAHPPPASAVPHLPDIHAQDVALIQYTSGSTTNPRGVTLYHSHLLHNLDIIAKALGTHHASLSWLPPYHDMGLIGGILQPLYAGYQSILISPLHFLRHPDIWLKIITDYRITNSGGPNFAYEYCVNKIPDEQLSQFDLSCWEVAFNGSEPIYEQTIKNSHANSKPVDSIKPRSIWRMVWLRRLCLSREGFTNPRKHCIWIKRI